MEKDAELDQSEVFAFLADPATYDLKEPVKRIDTHGAAVFLTGGDAYKVKRAVKFPFMDFSTLEKRRLACENEIAVNSANAPGLYLGVVPISREGSRLKFGPSPKIVEWAVHLARFDENSTLDRLAERGELDLALAAELGKIVAAAHQKAPVAKGRDTTGALRRQMDETIASLASAPETFEPVAVAGFGQRANDAFARLEPLLIRRENDGQARRCHGDLHLGNIVLIKSAPVLFDAIEFDDSIATSDILYDLGFLLMDLWVRGLPRHANLVLNRYLWACDAVEQQICGLAALPLFLALRAAIRAKVIHLRAGHRSDDLAAARQNFEAACRFLDQSGLDLVAIGGLPGTGKSTLAGLLAPFIGRAPGAVHLRTDIERKRLHRVGEFDRLPNEAYAPEHTGTTYRHVHHLAALALEAGQSIVIDAAHKKPAERLATAKIAEAGRARFTGLWLEAPVDVLRERVDHRLRDASDATADVVLAQAGEPAGVIDWLRLDASGPIEPLALEALELIRSSAEPAREARNKDLCVNGPENDSGMSV